MTFEEAKELRIELGEQERNNKEDLLAYTGLTPGEAIAFLNRFQDPDEQFDDNMSHGPRTFRVLDAFLVGAFAAVSYARLQSRKTKVKGGVAWTRKELFEKWDSRIDAVGESPYDFFKLVGMELPPEDALVFLDAMTRDPFYAMKAGIALGAEWQEQQFTKDKAKGVGT